MTPVYVLAGGASRRLGRDKAALEIGGRSLLERVVANCGATAVVSKRRPERLPAAVGHVADSGEGQAPILGLRAALEDATRIGAGVALVVAVDLPFLRRETLGRLTRKMAEQTAPPRVVAPLVDGRLQVLAAAWDCRLLPEVDQAVQQGRWSLRRLAEEIGCLVVSAEELGARPEEFFNLNRPVDLIRCRELLGCD